MEIEKSRPGFFNRAVRWTALFLPSFAAVLAALWWAARPVTPDAFYDYSGPLPDGDGTLLRSETFTRDVPPLARGWRILYTTTRANSSRIIASALIVAPSRATAAPRAGVAWAHGTTGLARGCAPSVVKPFANVPGLERILEKDWVYIAPDYVGLGVAGGHAYLVGDEAARALADAVNAARSLSEAAFNGRHVVWGHSQGGNTALWAGVRAREQPADLRPLGIAALAPASDLVALMETSRATPFGKIVSAYLIDAYAASYSDIRKSDYVSGFTGAVASDIASRCVGGLETLLSLGETFLLPKEGLFQRDITVGPLAARLSENTPNKPIGPPVLIAQGLADDLVSPRVQASYVGARCAAGQAIDYREFAGLDHLSLVSPNSALVSGLIEWTRDRLAGGPTRSTCGQ